MATKNDGDLFSTLRARGLRRSAARVLTDAAEAGRGGAGRGQKAARDVIDDLRRLADDLEGRITGKSSKRSAAAKKAANTRARKASARSRAAKKGAATRAKSTRGKTTRAKAKS